MSQTVHVDARDLNGIIGRQKSGWHHPFLDAVAET